MNETTIEKTKRIVYSQFGFDITFCVNYDCPNHETCRRNVENKILEYNKNGLSNYIPKYYSVSMFDRNNCPENERMEDELDLEHIRM